MSDNYGAPAPRQAYASGVAMGQYLGAWRDAFQALAEGMAAGLQAVSGVAQQTAKAIEKLPPLVDHRETIRRRFPEGIAGDFAASAEWQRQRIEQAAHLATERILAMGGDS